MKKFFENCMWEELTKLFNLERMKKMPALENLVQAEVSILVVSAWGSNSNRAFFLSTRIQKREGSGQ